jgi:sulfatase modifying factor 1
MPKIHLTYRATLLALVLSACHYDPAFPDGVVECPHGNSDCPARYACRPKPRTPISVCCKTLGCGFTTDDEAPDAAPALPRDAAPDRPVTPGPDASPPAPADAAGDATPDPPAPRDGSAADLPGADAAPDVKTTADLAEAGPPCPSSYSGPAMVRADSFCIDSTEVTNQQYAAFLAAKGSDVSGQPAACKWNTSYLPSTDGVMWPYLNGRADYPVGNVDWCDAFMFCRWSGKRLCGKIGGGRLASVQAAAGLTGQWLSACTGAGRLTFPYGPSLQRESCNIGAPTDAAMYVEPVQHRATCQGGYPDLYDMSGNMEEWVDGCDKDVGSADECAVAGSASFTGDLKPEDLTCHGSVFGAARNTRFYLLGFRCCAD